MACWRLIDFFESRIGILRVISAASLTAEMRTIDFSGTWRRRDLTFWGSNPLGRSRDRVDICRQMAFQPIFWGQEMNWS